MAKKTNEQRVADVNGAYAELAAALAAANADPTNVELWADVELLGAVIHRQSRILAGKSRGG